MHSKAERVRDITLLTICPHRRLQVAAATAVSSCGCNRSFLTNKRSRRTLNTPACMRSVHVGRNYIYKHKWPLMSLSLRCVFIALVHPHENSVHLTRHQNFFYLQPDKKMNSIHVAVLKTRLLQSHRALYVHNIERAVTSGSPHTNVVHLCLS